MTSDVRAPRVLRSGRAFLRENLPGADRTRLCAWCRGERSDKAPSGRRPPAHPDGQRGPDGWGKGMAVVSEVSGFAVFRVTTMLLSPASSCSGCCADRASLRYATSRYRRRFSAVRSGRAWRRHRSGQGAFVRSELWLRTEETGRRKSGRVSRGGGQRCPSPTSGQDDGGIHLTTGSWPRQAMGQHHPQSLVDMILTRRLALTLQLATLAAPALVRPAWAACQRADLDQGIVFRREDGTKGLARRETDTAVLIDYATDLGGLAKPADGLKRRV